jgi:hypothetical protein
MVRGNQSPGKAEGRPTMKTLDTSAYPEELIRIGADIIRNLAEKAASQRKVHEMLDYLELEKQLVEGHHHESS